MSERKARGGALDQRSRSPCRPTERVHPLASREQDGVSIGQYFRTSAALDPGQHLDASATRIDAVQPRVCSAGKDDAIVRGPSVAPAGEYDMLAMSTCAPPGGGVSSPTRRMGSRAVATCRAIASASASGKRSSEREPVGQRRPLDQFHDEDRGTRRVLDAKERGDVRMIERRQNARFPVEAGAAVGVGGPVAGQQFEGYLATQTRITRAIHLAHPARAERCYDLEHADVTACTASNPELPGFNAMAPARAFSACHLLTP